MPLSLETNLFYKASNSELESTRSILLRVQKKRASLCKKDFRVAAMPSSTRSSSQKRVPVNHSVKKKKIEAEKIMNGKHAAASTMLSKQEHVEKLDSNSSSSSETSESGSMSSSCSSTTKSPPTSPPQLLSLPGLNVSEYEMKMQENIQERMKFLSSLNIEETKNEVLKLCPTPKPSATQDRGISKIKKRPSPRSPVPVRKSLRLSQKPPETTPKPDPVYERADSDTFIRPEAGGALIDYLNVKLNKDEATKMLEHTKRVSLQYTQQPCNWTGSLPTVLSHVSKLRLEDQTVAKAVPQRIMSMAFHPSTTDDVVFAGDKSGHLGIWHVDRKDEVDGTWCFNVHGGGINCLSVDAGNSSRVITTSYDGSTRATDLERLVVDDVLSWERTSQRDYLTWHAQQAPHVLLVGCGDGSVARVDMRERATVRKQLDQKRSIKVVTVHPVASHYFVSSNARGEVRLWDLRSLKNASSSICSFSHPNTASAVRFSPVTGNTLITTSSDDKIRLLSLKSFSSIEQKRSISHFNQTGRWLTTLKADFLPGREDAFIVGSLDRRRVIEVWEADDKKSSPVLLSGEQMTTYSSTVCCHPSRFVVAGGNSSGKCHVFR